MMLSLDLNAECQIQTWRESESGDRENEWLEAAATSRDEDGN